MNKELFVSTINSIKKQIEIDRKNSSMLRLKPKESQRTLVVG